ncbi:MAG TPA: hypothetical protein VGP06_13760, partial [Janthinobacterium sp.]|nr:hypothetical protein [Janthinobacterium sp.]
NNLGNVFAAAGMHEQAVPHFVRATQLNPGFMQAHSNMLYAMTHVETLAPAQMFEQHRRVGALMAAGAGAPAPHLNTREGQRPLRIGFVSADLRQHPVTLAVEPIWAQWAGSDLQIWVYHNSIRENETSLRLQGLVHGWRQVAQLDDQALARQFRADRIDILIDLSGHTGHNRLPLFALKPAPVQASWLGYPASTGLAAIDYYLADRHLAPHGEMEQFFTEQMVRLRPTTSFRPIPTRTSTASKSTSADKSGFRTAAASSLKRPAPWPARTTAALPGACCGCGRKTATAPWWGRAAPCSCRSSAGSTKRRRPRWP